MSDEDVVVYKKPKKTIHYGSLENSEWLKQQPLEEIQSDEDDYEPESKKPALATTNNSITTNTASGNINISNEYFDLEQEMYSALYFLYILLDNEHVCLYFFSDRKTKVLYWKNLSEGERHV